jgi:phosphate transport system substrate-binding protein
MGRGIRNLFLAIYLAGCVSRPDTTATPFSLERMATTPELEGIVSSWLAAYVEQTGEANLQLDVLSSQEILPSLESGVVEAAFVAQEVPEGWFASPLVREPIVVIVNSQVTIVSLKVQDLKDLFSGQVKSWENLADNDLPIQLYIPFPGSVFRERFAQQILAESPFDPSARLGSTPEEILEMVRLGPGGIGFIPMEEVEENINLIAVAGVLPSDELLEDSEYPVWIDLLVLSPQEPSGYLREFIVWLQGTYLPEMGD